MYAYSKLYNIPSTGLRFFTVYGPAGRPDMAYFGFTNKLLKGETIQICLCQKFFMKDREKRTQSIRRIQFIQALLEANELAVGKDHQFKGRYEAEKNAVIISLENDEREC